MAKENSTDLTMDSPGGLREDHRANIIAMGSLVEKVSRTWPRAKSKVSLLASSLI